MSSLCLRPYKCLQFVHLQAKDLDPLRQMSDAQGQPKPDSRPQTMAVPRQLHSSPLRVEGSSGWLGVREHTPIRLGFRFGGCPDRAPQTEGSTTKITVSQSWSPEVQKPRREQGWFLWAGRENLSRGSLLDSGSLGHSWACRWPFSLSPGHLLSTHVYLYIQISPFL